MFIEYMLRVRIRPHRGRIVSSRNVSIKIKSLRDYNTFNFKKIPANSEFEKILMIGIQTIMNNPKDLKVYKTYAGGGNPNTTFIEKKYS